MGPRSIWVVLGIALLGGALALWARRSGQQPALQQPALLELPLATRQEAPAQYSQTVLLAAAPSAGNYKNAETWDIEWNKEGLPSKVTIHRDASRT